MNSIAENPVAIVMVGIVLLTLALVVYTQTRGTRSLVAMAVIVLITLVALGIERWVVTPREEVAAALDELSASIEAGDVPATLARIDPSAMTLRDLVSAMLPKVKLEKARVASTPQITVDPGDPQRAMARFRAIVDGVHGSTQARFGFFDRVELEFVRVQDRWLLVHYELLSGQKIPSGWRR